MRIFMLIFWLHSYLIVYTELADIMFHPSWILLTDIRQLHSSAFLHHDPQTRSSVGQRSSSEVFFKALSHRTLGPGVMISMSQKT